jgi:hypothetical protein
MTASAPVAEGREERGDSDCPAARCDALYHSGS